MSELRRGYFRMGLDCSEWPSKEYEVAFRGHKLRLMPESETLAPSIIVRLDGSLTQTEARALLQAFLSTLAWTRDAKFVETFSTFSTGAPIGVGKARPGPIRRNAPMDYLPDPSDRKARLALALYREALSVNMAAYAFLGYFKVINILFKSSDDQKKWIRQSVFKLTEKDAVKRLAEISARETDVGKYLFVSGRCAVAHAYADPIADPDEPSDQQRLACDLPVMKALAKYAIENELHVQSQGTVWREHLYELEGFRALFGSEAVADLKAGKEVETARLPLPEKLSIRLQGGDSLPSFESLDAAVLDATNGVVRLRLTSPDGRLDAVVRLNFQDERLVFDALNEVRIDDDGSAAAASVAIDYMRYLKEWMVNGVNEVWDPSRGLRLGRSEPVMLVNMRPDWDAIDAKIRALQDRSLQSSEPSGTVPNPAG